jgi:hypothetical protein
VKSSVKKTNTQHNRRSNNMQKKTAVNKEAFRMLALEIGLNAACRKLGVPIPTGKSWARRGGWKLSKRPGGRPGRALTASSASSLHPIADALVATHKELEERTKSGLAQATARAAEAAATAPEPLEVSNTAHLRDLAAAASRLFGWDALKGPQVTLNQLCVTTEQLQQIRALREQAEVESS